MLISLNVPFCVNTAKNLLMLGVFLADDNWVMLWLKLYIAGGVFFFLPTKWIIYSLMLFFCTYVYNLLNFFFFIFHLNELNFVIGPRSASSEISLTSNTDTKKYTRARTYVHRFTAGNALLTVSVETIILIRRRKRHSKAHRDEIIRQLVTELSNFNIINSIWFA